MSTLPPPPPGSPSLGDRPADAPEHCYRHRDRETGRRCTRCGRPACGDCLRPVAVGSHCPECVKAAAPALREQVKFWNARQHFLMTLTLIGLNVAAYLWSSLHAGSDSLNLTIDQYGLYGPAIHDGHEWWRIVTSGFLHASFFHILMNMAALAQMGRMLEQGYGRVRFGVLYAVSLVCGAAGALILTPHSLTVGASGAIFGLLGALAVNLRQRGISIWQTGIGGLIVINLLITLAVPSISVGGHVGGLIGGAVTGMALDQRGADGKRSVVGIAVAVAIGLFAVAVALSAAGR